MDPDQEIKITLLLENWPRMCGGQKLSEWLGERYQNCLRIAETKNGDDKVGWLEDAANFLAARIIVEGAENAIDADG